MLKSPENRKKYKPIHLFKASINNQNDAFFFITDSDHEFWMKQEPTAWEAVIIDRIEVLRDGGSTTYYFSGKGYDELYIPSFVRKKETPYISKNSHNKVYLNEIHLSAEKLQEIGIAKEVELDVSNIPRCIAEARETVQTIRSKETVRSKKNYSDLLNKDLLGFFDALSEDSKVSELGVSSSREQLTKERCSLKIEQLAQSFPNLEQDNSKIPETALVAEIKAQIANIVTEIEDLQASLLIYIEAREAMKKIDSDKNDPFTENDMDGEIKLINRKIHFRAYLKFTKEVKIEALSTKGIHLEPEFFESLLKLRLQEKETRKVIQDLKLAIVTFKRVFDDFSKHLSKQPSLVDFKIKEYMNQKIRLFEKNNLKSKSQLENIEEEIKRLKEPKFNQDISLVASQAKQSFFKGKPERGNSTTELKTQESYINRI
ncbi:hypothetical protein FQR65_LT05165 [Abscondita terminalis]|nr:hypothetical protein FQR65_LT05165 [Abscondita terminalis]